MKSILCSVGLAVLAALGMVIAPNVATAQPCFYATCDTGQECAYKQGTNGKVCCSKTCQGGPGGVSCVCALRCSHSCGSGITPNCSNCQDSFAQAAAVSGGDQFAFSPMLDEQVATRDVFAALLLRSLSQTHKSPIRSTRVSGSARIAGVGPFEYVANLLATTGNVTIDVTFRQLPYGPDLPPRTIVVSSDGAVARHTPERTRSAEIARVASASEAACVAAAINAARDRPSSGSDARP